MTKLINLRQARKDRARKSARTEADANAARHGLTKAERARQQKEEARETRFLDARKLDEETP